MTGGGIVSLKDFNESGIFLSVSRVVGIIAIITCLASMGHAQQQQENHSQWPGALLKNVTRETTVEIDRRHDRWIADHPVMPLTRTFQYATQCGQSPQRKARQVESNPWILVIADHTLYDDLRAKAAIDRYVDDIGNSPNGDDIIFETVTGGTPEDLKNIIRGYHETHGLDGVVFIGQIIPAWFEVANDHAWWKGGYGYAKWTCDLYYMDLDGNWFDADQNGIYDIHMNGGGDRSPEIFVGRIDPSTMGYYNDEVTLLCNYMEKNHAYWTAAVTLPQDGLIYTDYDFIDCDDSGLILMYGLQNITYLQWTLADNTVLPSDYLTKRLTTDYGFLQLWTHATWWGHSFHDGIVTSGEVYRANPKPRGYNIIGCHAADWTAGSGRYFLCGAYIYNNSPTSLTLTASTKSGGMLWCNHYYTALKKNDCIGNALENWFSYVIENDYVQSGNGYEYIIGWFYGMMIVGDPMIRFIDTPTRIDARNAPEVIADGFTLFHNYPDPFNAETTIGFSIPEKSDIVIRIIDALGRPIKTYKPLDYPQGLNQVTWDGTDDRGNPMPSGMYMVQVHYLDRVKTQRMILLH